MITGGDRGANGRILPATGFASSLGSKNTQDLLFPHPLQLPGGESTSTTPMACALEGEMHSFHLPLA